MGTQGFRRTRRYFTNFFFQVDSSIYLLDQVFQAQPGGDPGLDWDTLKRLCLSDGFGTPHCLPRRAASHWGDRGPCLDCCTHHSDRLETQSWCVAIFVLRLSTGAAGLVEMYISLIFADFMLPVKICTNIFSFLLSVSCPLPKPHQGPKRTLKWNTNIFIWVPCFKSTQLKSQYYYRAIKKQ